MRKVRELLHHNAANTANTTNTGFSSSGFANTSTSSPYSKYGNFVPASVLNWQQGQPIPQGWRLGNSGFLRPIYTLPSNLQSWQQGQPIPQGYRVGKRGTLKPLNYSFLSGNTVSGSGFTSSSSPYAKYGNFAPASVLNWQRGQPIPQGWRLGNSGFLRPIYTLPSNLQSWRQGQPIPEGYRLGKRGTLKPLSYSFLGSNNFDTLNSSSTIVRTTAPVVEHREKAAVVQEVIRPGLREEIQPVIHREREQLEIREELLPIYEKSVRPTIVEERQLAAEIKPEVRLGSAPVLAAGPRSSTVVEAEHREAIMNAPIVEETIHKKIIEEVQPVIHRETIAPRIIHERKDVYEKIIEAPVVTYTTLPAKYMGTQHASIISSWSQGQPIPEGYRLGKRGYLKPVFVLPTHLQSWRQGQPIPEGYRVSKRGTLKPMGHNYNSFANNGGNFNSLNSGMSNLNLGSNAGMMSSSLPAEVANWRQGQPIPQGYRLGRKGFLKPSFTLPAHLQNWQQGQAVPEGYRVGKRGTLKPLNYNNNFFGNNFNTFNNTNKLQQANSAYVPTTVQKF